MTIAGRLPSLGLLLLVACGDDAFESGDGPRDDAGADIAGTVDIDDFIAAYCQVARACCPDVDVDVVLSDCEVEVERQMDIVQMTRAGTVDLVHPEFDRCVASLRAEADGCNAAQVFSDDCARAFQGTVVEGGACDHGSECHRDGYPVVCLKLRDADMPDVLGTCHRLAQADEDEACALDGRGESASATYSAPSPGPALAYCERDQGLYCPFSEGVCRKLPTEGQGCDRDCSTGLYCDDQTSTCAPELAEGTPCESHGQCASGLGCFEGRCRAPSVSDTKICRGDFN